MIHAKIVMLGAFGVGKTSLVSRFVRSIFEERYLTTVGVKIDKKEVLIEDEELTFVLWDIAGKDAINDIKPSHLQGSNGYILVADGCRAETLDIAVELQQMAKDTLGDVPFVLVVNKADLRDNWELTESDLQSYIVRDWSIVVSSAKTGANVEEVFDNLASRILRKIHGGEQPTRTAAR